MTDADRFMLLFDPSGTPRSKDGATFICELRGALIVGGLTDAPIL